MSEKELAKGFLENLKNLSKDKKLSQASKTIENSIVSGNRVAMQQALDQYVNHLSDIVLGHATQVIQTPAFAALDAEGKATMIRKYLSMGAKVGYAESSTATLKVYQELLKSVGLVTSPAPGKMDPERLKGAVAGSIKHAIADDGRLETSMRDSFNQIIRSGTRDTIAATSAKIEAKTGQSILVKRMTGSDPCKYCADHSGTWFKADTHENFSRYHDSCKCHIEMKVGQLSRAERALEDEYSSDDFRQGSEIIDDFEDLVL
jgi:hypothetical protein